jgi:hypothetical protein
MMNNRKTARMQWLFTASFLAVAITSASAGQFTRGCAARDLQVQAMIAEREGVHAISEQKLQETFVTLLEARMVCHGGRVVDALAMYDGIVQNIAHDAFTFGLKQ